jgi:hypothetical protein
MISEYSIESFQRVTRYPGHYAVCGGLPALAREFEAAIEGSVT